ncbi:MAG TPA: LytTR family DNA-binding domain-containing protein [Ramlibacter sp.]|jgi:hypothetical protein|uniref:LytTR family DNA-binding domain-containing protein n=1 Tax=Ramlibacter sp. TaxID=1917967 RepID=UPI002D5E872C|nr:LytTR family DNA-binding domain-containing protein [Ramlibacter sp.]HZY17351.1 LytTR family DNA-binding domain-containing protein [Ramlibacter sp.]
MADLLPSWLARYRRHERAFDVGFWVTMLGGSVAFNSVVDWIDLGRGPVPHPYAYALTLQLTSVVVVGALIPLLVWWERRHPLRLGTLPGCLGWHLAGSVGFSLLHAVGMVGLRLLVIDGHRVADWATVLVYEYLKDVRSYALIVGSIAGWRLLLLRTQGEARLLDPPDAPATGRPPDGGGTSAAVAPGPHAPVSPMAAAPAAPPAAPSRPERFLVRKLRKEFLVAAADIDWLQAQGNYLGLRVHGHDYLLRSTLTDFLAQLDPARFVRVHRSWAVNLDRIAEIEPLEAGDARLRMKDGSLVPCSRRYRDALGTAR